MRLSRLKHFLSYLYPVRVRSGSSIHNPVLELLYYQGGWQLGATDVLYSDGYRYRPLVAAFKQIERRLPGVHKVLVLGTGLGSAVSILHRMGFHPHFTLVELDAVVLDWARELLPAADRIDFRCADAREFVAQDSDHYDLVIADIFRGRQVPPFVLEPDFLRQCRQLLQPEGILILNFMVNAAEEEQQAAKALEGIYREVQEIAFGINRVYLATA